MVVISNNYNLLVYDEPLNREFSIAIKGSDSLTMKEIKMSIIIMASFKINHYITDSLRTKFRKDVNIKNKGVFNMFKRVPVIRCKLSDFCHGYLISSRITASLGAF